MLNKQQEVFTDILDKNKGLIYKVVNAYCAEISERADLIQEIILQLWSSFDSYDENYKLSTWIYRVALNTAITHHRKTSKIVDRVNKLDNAAMNTIPAEDPYVEDQNLILLNKFIQELKEIDRAIILL